MLYAGDNFGSKLNQKQTQWKGRIAWPSLSVGVIFSSMQQQYDNNVLAKKFIFYIVYKSLQIQK